MEVTTNNNVGFIIGQDKQLTKEAKQKELEKRKRFDRSYGAMTMIMAYLPQIEQLKLQSLDTWWYCTGVGRVQVQLCLRPRMFYFTNERTYIQAVSERGECQQFKNENCGTEFTNYDWVSCQVGRSHLF